MLKDCSVRSQCHQITGVGDFSFPFLKLDSYLHASTTELEPLAERGLFNGAPSCHGSQTHLLNPSPGAGIGYQAGRQAGTFTAPGNLSKMLISRGSSLVWRGPLGHGGDKIAFQTDAGAEHWMKGTDFLMGLLTNVLN